MPDEQHTLQKQIGLFGVFSVAAGAMISSGLFVLPGLAFGRIGPAMILAYAIAGVLNIPTMLAQAELATAMPRSAGSYFVVERSLGAYVGTIAGLINWCAIGLKAAFAFVGFGALSLYFLPESEWTIKFVAIGCCAFFVILNLISAGHASKLQNILVAVLIGILVAYILGSASSVESSHYQPFFKGDFSTFLGVIGMVFISFGGLAKVVDIAGEVKSPGRNLPLGMFLAYAIVMVLYIAVVALTVGIVPADLLDGSLKPVTEGAGIVFGSVGSIAIGVAAAFAYLTTGNAGVLSASRSPMAMSRDGLLPEIFSRQHKRFGTPHIAIFLTGGLMMLVIALLSVEDLVKTASTMLLISLALMNISVVVMRQSGIEGYRPTFRVPLCPWLPLGGVVLYGFLIAEMGLVPLLTSACFVAVASIWYVVYVQKRIDREAAVVFLVKSILSRHIQRAGLEDELVKISLERDEIVTDRFDTLVRQAPILDIADPIKASALFEKIGEALSSRIMRTPAQIRDMLIDREHDSSTMILPGLAIPHVIVPGENVFELAVVRCQEGAIFSEMHPPVRIAFALLGSADQRNFHLKALMAIAHVVQEPGFEERWRKATNAEQLRDILILSSRSRHRVE